MWWNYMIVSPPMNSLLMKHLVCVLQVGMQVCAIVRVTLNNINGLGFHIADLNRVDSYWQYTAANIIIMVSIEN